MKIEKVNLGLQNEKRRRRTSLQGEKRRRTRVYWVEREEGALGFTV